MVGRSETAADVNFRSGMQLSDLIVQRAALKLGPQFNFILRNIGIKLHWHICHLSLTYTKAVDRFLFPLGTPIQSDPYLIKYEPEHKWMYVTNPASRHGLVHQIVTSHLTH